MQAKKKLELEEYRPEEGDSDDDVEPNKRRRHSAGRDFYLSRHSRDRARMEL